MSDRLERFSKMTDGTQIVEDILNDRTVGDKWFMGMDFDAMHNPGEMDGGTRRVPMSRVALLTDSGLLPASMMPHTVSEMIEGDMTYDSATHQWTFTAADGRVFGCPAKQGLVPDDSVIYVDNTPAGEDYYQYMFVPAQDATDENLGTFYCLPSPYMLVDGDATHIHDDVEEYTRSINVRVGDDDEQPSDFSGTMQDYVDPEAALRIVEDDEGKKLVHVKHMESDEYLGEYGASVKNPEFGDTIKLGWGKVNTSGHLLRAGSVDVTIPATAAGTETPGLVVIGTETPNPIGTKASAGGAAKVGDYVKVAAADHTHTARPLTITCADTEVTYNGSAEKSVNLNGVFGVPLPSEGPGVGDILTYNGTELEWVDPKSLYVPSMISVYTENAYDISGDDEYFSYETYNPIDACGTLSTNNGKITGLVGKKTYLLNYSIRMNNTTVSEYFETIGIYVSYPNLAIPTPMGSHVINTSYLGDQYINGSALVYMPAFATTASILIGNISGLVAHGKWSTQLMHLQVAEMK